MKLSQWRHVHRKILHDCKVFKLLVNRWRSESDQEHDFFALECADWVNVIALTDDGELLLVRQYRFGIEAFTLEIPGGVVDPGESPLEAARRELLEETGHAPRSIVPLGTIHPNPAIQANITHTFLATGCVRVAQLHLDATEQIELVRVPVSEVDNLLQKGEFSHALVAVAFLHWKQRGSPLR